MALPINFHSPNTVFPSYPAPWAPLLLIIHQGHTIHRTFAPAIPTAGISLLIESSLLTDLPPSLCLSSHSIEEVSPDRLVENDSNDPSITPLTCFVPFYISHNLKHYFFKLKEKLLKYSSFTMLC